MKQLGMVASSAAAIVTILSISLGSQAQSPPPASPFKEQMRMPWTRGSTDFIRNWIVAGPLDCKLDEDCLGGEGAVRPAVDTETKRPDGSVVKWRFNRPWGDYATIDGEGATADKVSYAFANIPRDQAGKATLSLGSVNGLRAWINGKQVLVRDGERARSPDNDQVDVDLNAGDNALLIKVASNAGFVARVLEIGAVAPRVNEITPSLVDGSEAGFSIVTDVSAARAAAEPVAIEVIRPGGEVAFRGSARRGDKLRVDAANFPDGPYEVRASTANALGLIHTAHIPWYKGNALVLARELAAEAARADKTRPEGLTLIMLASMVEDRLGVKLAEATGNPWADIHSPLMEYAELLLERGGKVGRVRPHGFVRLAWLDETDNTPQFCRAYLPGGYAASRRWPLVLQLHGFNPANPLYWDWWSADTRHGGPDTEFAGHQGVIYIAPHGRGNTQYLTLGDADVLRCMAEARKLLSIDENRTYLTGDSMGGWGTWNVATRHPELFAAIAPIFGGVDYHSTMSEELAKTLTPAERFINEKQSSWGMADSLINTPVFVHHGDADAAVNVEWSRWGVRLMQRWGYDIRYREYPGRIHEELQVNNGTMNIDWFLRHVRDPDPRKVRIRSGELRNAAAWWIRVQQAAKPLEFMRVDAEVVDRNLIRLDTDNVIDVVLTPSAKLIDAAKPVRVVWNGVSRELRVTQGSLRLTEAGYKPAAPHKSPTLPGATGDFLYTPFAVVIGTSSRDAAMRETVAAKAKGFVDAWRDWQKFEPRVFKDTEITDADIAKYSLLLIGGADANAVTAKLASKLPLKVSAQRVVIDGKAFAATDATVQMIYPNPRNADRYVWVFAATSPAGMQFAMPTPFRTGVWDYIIEDGRIPPPRQQLPMERMNIVAGSFDYNWRFNPAYLQMGDTEVRAKGRVLGMPGKDIKLPQALLDSYAGTYELRPGRLVEVSRKGDILWVKAGNDELEFVPLDQTSFYGQRFNIWVTFEKDATGKVTGFTGHQPGEGDFEGKKQ
jgi:dienelactone hydrolase